MALPRPYDPNDPYAQQPMRAPLPYAPMPGREPLGSGFAVQPPTPAPEPAQLPPEQIPPEPPTRGAASPADVGSDEKARLAETMNDPAFGDYVTANQKPDKGWQVLDALFSGLQGKQYDQGYWQQNAKQFDEANLKDPHSEESHKLRQANAPMLQQLGLQPDEIAHLSGADIASVSKGGNLVEGLLTARQKAQQAKAVAEAKAADAAAKHTQDEADWAAHNQITSGQQDERTRTMAGIGAQNAATQAAISSGLSLRNAETMNEVGNQQRIEAEQRAEARRIEDEKRKAAEAAAKTEQTYVQPEELEASNKHITVTNPNLLHQTQATNKRSSSDIRNDIKTSERAGHTYDQMLADEAAWSKGSAVAKAQVLAGVPLSDEAKELATVKARYEAFGTELQGIKSKIAQSAGSAAEREDAKHEIPSIMAPSARQKLIGVGGMLESNANANLGATGMTVNFTKGASKGEIGAPAAKKGGGGIRARDPKTGQTGSWAGTREEAIKAGFEVL